MLEAHLETWKQGGEASGGGGSRSSNRKGQRIVGLPLQQVHHRQEHGRSGETGLRVYDLNVRWEGDMRRTLTEVERCVALWSLAVDTASVTGRVIFGQLWYPDPSVDDLLRASYERSIADYMNSVSPLQAFFGST